MTNVDQRPWGALDRIMADGGVAVRASTVFAGSTLPSGELRLLRPASVGPVFGRAYRQIGQYVDCVAWQAIVTGGVTRSSDLATSAPEQLDRLQQRLFSRFGYSHSIAAPLESPLIAGYPGVLVAMRGVGSAPFTTDDMSVLRQAARAFDTRMALGNEPVRERRLFIATGSSEVRFHGGSPAVSGMDTRLAGEVEQLAASVLRSARRGAGFDAPGGDRVLLPDSSGVGHPYRSIFVRDFPAIAVGQPVTLIARVPACAEWLRLSGADFVADEETARLLPAVRVMFEQYARGITLPSIAQSVHLSPFHFHRRFTERLGITPKHFLYDCQVAHAQSLLVEAKTDLSRVAKLCGFAHQSHFTSRFKQATGLTPTRWRKAVMSKLAAGQSAEPRHTAQSFAMAGPAAMASAGM